MSPGAELLKLHLRADKLPFEEEFRFCPQRKWRADFRLGNLLVEVDGGNRMAVNVGGRAIAVGRHTLDTDYEKLNAAVLLGYRVLRFSPSQVRKGIAIQTIKRALNG